VGLIQPRGLQLAPQHADPLPQASSDGPRVVVRASGSRLHRFPAAGLVAGHQGVHPAPGHLVSACCFGLAQLLLYHRQDDDPFLRHGSSSKAARYERCLDSPMNDVLNHDSRLCLATSQGRRMRDSNPRGREPNPLSKSANRGSG
jgi:hypothetical protein